MQERIGFIGAGAVGTSFGQFLQSKGQCVVGYYSLAFSDAVEASSQVRGTPFDSLRGVIEASDLIGITVNDDAIESVVKAICETVETLVGKVCFHTSGAHSASVLQPLEALGAIICSIHPLQSFPKGKATKQHYEGIYFSVEGEQCSRVVDWMKGMALQVMTLKPEEKSAYHLAAVTVSNFLVPLIAEGIMYFKRFGLDEASSYQALKPLIMGTLNNIEKVGLSDALTGPFARGDLSTVEKHLATISDEMALAYYKMNGLKALEHMANYQTVKQEHKAIEALLKE